MNATIESALQRLAAPVPASCKDGMAERADALRAVADRLEAEAEKHARLMAQEMGKPVAQGKAEAEKCAWVCRHYAENAADYLADDEVDSGRAESLVTCAPLGIVLAVMPWNFPYWQVFRFAAPAIMAGNRVLLKHASNVPGCGQAIDTLIREASGRDDLLAFAEIASGDVAGVIADGRIAALTFTGSTDAGRKVASECGRHLKKCVLELGGSDPYLVLEDADLSHTAAVCAKARMINGGQSCIAAKRLIVVDAALDRFTEHLLEELSAYQMGDPLEPETKLGPLARPDRLDCQTAGRIEPVHRRVGIPHSKPGLGKHPGGRRLAHADGPGQPYDNRPLHSAKAATTAPRAAASTIGRSPYQRSKAGAAW